MIFNVGFEGRFVRTSQLPRFELRHDSLENATYTFCGCSDAESEAFQPLHQMPFEVFRMEMIEVVATEFLVSYFQS
jgi:hypothetical protein